MGWVCRCLLALVSVVLLAAPTHAAERIVIATETAAGEYEGGTFTETKPELRRRFTIDESQGVATLTETVRLGDGTVIEDEVVYQIVVTEEGTELSNFLASEDRQGQRILTLVGKPGSLATEVILLGEDFFDYFKASAGRFYLSTGTVEWGTSLEEDTARRILKAPQR